MKQMSIRLSDDLMNWVSRQASNNLRTKNQQITYILEQAKKSNDTPRYQLGKDGLCHNGVHLFGSSEVSTKDMCNCGMYVLGELQ